MGIADWNCFLTKGVEGPALGFKLTRIKQSHSASSSFCIRPSHQAWYEAPLCPFCCLSSCLTVITAGCTSYAGNILLSRP